MDGLEDFRNTISNNVDICSICSDKFEETRCPMRTDLLYPEGDKSKPEMKMGKRAKHTTQQKASCRSQERVWKKGGLDERTNAASSFFLYQEMPYIYVEFLEPQMSQRNNNSFCLVSCIIMLVNQEVRSTILRSILNMRGLRLWSYPLP